MEVELITGYRSEGLSPKMEEREVRKAGSEELQSMETLLRMLSQHEMEMEMGTVTKVKKEISHLGHTRTGHARFRRAPLPSSLLQSAGNTGDSDTEDEKKMGDFSSRVYCPTPIQRLPMIGISMNGGKEPAAEGPTSSPLSVANPFVSLLTGDAVTKQPLSTGLRRKCGWNPGDGSAKCVTVSGRCHCSKRRKSRAKRVVRVPAISSKMADIPSDNFSWRKYGQKPIKGSPHPRGYYKCSSVRGCPARKHVEKAVDDPSMLIITYEGDHNHTNLSISQGPPALVLESSDTKINC